MAAGGKKKDTNGSKSRIALTALGASGEKANGQCLSSEEIAEFAENSCSADEREKFLDHLGECNTCYTEWLYLRGELVKERGRLKHLPVLRLLRSSKGLPYVGTALGIAAAVAIFLNIQMDYVRLGKEKISTEAMDEVKLPPAAVESDKKLEYRMETDIREEAPAGIDSPLPEKSQGGRMAEEYRAGERDKAAVKKSPAAEPPAPSREQQAALDPSTTAFSRLQVASGSSLLSMLRQGCRKGQKESSFWLDLSRRLEKADVTSFNGVLDQQHLATLVTLSTQLAKGEDREKYCAEVLDILDNLQ